MDGPVHRIAIDKTGTKIAIACGKGVMVVDQNTICMSSDNFPGPRSQLNLTASFLDQHSKVA